MQTTVWQRTVVFFIFWGKMYTGGYVYECIILCHTRYF